MNRSWLYGAQGQGTQIDSVDDKEVHITIPRQKTRS